MARYSVISCHVLWRELCYYASISKNVFDFNYLRQGLHNTPDLLRSELQAAIDKVSPKRDAILIGYGLCSRGIEDIVARGVPLVVMRGHDCITFLLGSKERYREYFDEHPGTYWYSPGWIDTGSQPGKERYASMRKHYIDTYGEENAEYLMNATETWMTNYTNAAYVDLGFYETEEYKAFTRKCAKWLDWNCDIIEGYPKLVVDFLEGNWDEERFLVVQPGERIIATHDDRIIGAEPVALKEESTVLPIELPLDS